MGTHTEITLQYTFPYSTHKVAKLKYMYKATESVLVHVCTSSTTPTYRFSHAFESGTSWSPEGLHTEESHRGVGADHRGGVEDLDPGRGVGMDAALALGAAKV